MRIYIRTCTVSYTYLYCVFEVLRLCIIFTNCAESQFDLNIIATNFDGLSVCNQRELLRKEGGPL